MIDSKIYETSIKVKIILLISGIIFIILLWPMIDIAVALKIPLYCFIGIGGIILPMKLAELLLKKHSNLNMRKACVIAIVIVLIIPTIINLLYIIKYNTVVQGVTIDGKVNLQLAYSKNLIYNDSVGNDWSFDISVNGNKYAHNEYVKKIVVDYNSKINMNAKITEIDSISDIGTGAVDIAVADMNFTNANKYTIPITVTENRGRYSGNTAKWELVFTVKRDIGFWDIVLG